MKTITTIILFLILFFPSQGFSSSQTLNEANTFFAQAVDTENRQEADILLDKALLRYEQLYRDHPSGRLAYNIGNTYYQQGNKPMALVYYKRAFKDIPTDKNLLHNLELVREELHLDNSQPETMLPWLPAVLHTYRLPIFFSLYTLFWITASMRYAKRRLMPLTIPVVLLFLSLAGSTIIGMEYLQPRKPEGIIIAADTMGRQGNGRSFEPSFDKPLTPGTEFQILEKRGYWLRIKLNQGEECWIPTRSCEIV
jgi:tetratricopeptide (TPR) repeat protein